MQLLLVKQPENDNYPHKRLTYMNKHEFWLNKF
jgi:hypothetical protein